jgi:hypothetical protein
MGSWSSITMRPLPARKSPIMASGTSRKFLA